MSGTRTPVRPRRSFSRLAAAAITAAVVVGVGSSPANAAELTVRAKHATEDADADVIVRTRGLSDDTERALVLERRRPDEKCGATPRRPRANWVYDFSGNSRERLGVDDEWDGADPPQTRRHRVKVCVWVTTLVEAADGLGTEASDQVVLGPVGRTARLRSEAEIAAIAEESRREQLHNNPLFALQSLAFMCFVLAGLLVVRRSPKTRRGHHRLSALVLFAGAVALPSVPPNLWVVVVVATTALVAYRLWPREQPAARSAPGAVGPPPAPEAAPAQPHPRPGRGSGPRVVRRRGGPRTLDWDVGPLDDGHRVSPSDFASASPRLRTTTPGTHTRIRERLRPGDDPAKVQRGKDGEDKVRARLDELLSSLLPAAAALKLRHGVPLKYKKSGHEGDVDHLLSVTPHADDPRPAYLVVIETKAEAPKDDHLGQVVKAAVKVSRHRYKRAPQYRIVVHPNSCEPVTYDAERQVARMGLINLEGYLRWLLTDPASAPRLAVAEYP